MANINFKPGNQKQRMLKRAPSKYQESGGRPNISMSDGIAPAYPAVPYKYLPASFQDINTQDMVVIPKGRLVSMVLSTTTASPTWDANWNTGVKGGVAPYNAIELADDSYFGVSKNIKGLLVPANGGVAQTYNMGALSVGAVPKSGSNAMVAAASETLSIGANAPVGAMEHDVYQDIRGANLNYDMRNKNWGVLAQQFIKLPCVDLAKWNAESATTTGKFCPNAVGSVLADQADDTHTVINASVDTETVQLDLDAGFAFSSVAGGDAVDTNIVKINNSTQTFDLAADDFSFDPATGVITLLMASGTNNATFANGDVLVITWQAVDEDAGADAPGVASSVYGQAGYAGYEGVMDKFAWLTFNSEVSGGGAAGSLLKSDCFGNWMGESYDANGIQSRTQQTAGRLLGVDNRFEKDLLDTVQSRYEDNAAFAVAGAGTYGVPQYLYNFAYASLVAAGWTVDAGKEASTIKALCDAGVFGEAWIQLNCQ